MQALKCLLMPSYHVSVIPAGYIDACLQPAACFDLTKRWMGPVQQLKQHHLWQHFKFKYRCHCLRFLGARFNEWPSLCCDLVLKLPFVAESIHCLVWPVSNWQTWGSLRVWVALNSVKLARPSKERKDGLVSNCNVSTAGQVTSLHTCLLSVAMEMVECHSDLSDQLHSCGGKFNTYHFNLRDILWVDVIRQF